MKISIVGMGRVGGALAFGLVARGVTHELVLVGRSRDRTLGDAYDLLHASAFVRRMRIKAGELADVAGSDIILIAASAAVDRAGDRLASAADNAALLQEIVPELADTAPEAIFVVVTNPVDVCTYFTLRASGLAANQVLGTGTLIDTGRFRALISEETGIDASDIRAYILGEHGESQFPALSVASAGGVRLDEPASLIRAHFEEARRGGDLVMRHKGHTNFAVAMSAILICEAIARDSHVILPVSTYVDGFKGVSDVCLSLPCVIGRRGVERVLSIDLDEAETAQLQRSARVLRDAIDRLESK